MVRVEDINVISLDLAGIHHLLLPGKKSLALDQGQGLDLALDHGQGKGEGPEVVTG